MARIYHIMFMYPPLSGVLDLPDGTEFEAYTGSVSGIGGSGSGYVYTKTVGPSWMVVDSSTGAITGTPDVDGVGIPVSIQIEDSRGTIVVVSDTITVAEGAVDPGWAFVTALMHFDGANGSTTVVEETGLSTWVRDNVGAEVSTAHPKFGVGYWDTSNTFLHSTSINTAFDFGTGDWANEFWLWIDAFTDQTVFDNRRGTYSTEIVLYVPTAGATTLAFYVNGANRATTSSLSLNTWYHIRMGRSSGNCYLKLNGVQQGSNYAFAGNMNSSKFVYGTNYLGAGPLNGGFDDIRVTRGYDRFAEAVPTAAYPNQ